ncbi:MAG: hypothetical protein R2860_04500 [Desulfobacterales bacterium]
MPVCRPPTGGRRARKRKKYRATPVENAGEAIFVAQDGKLVTNPRTET